MFGTTFFNPVASTSCKFASLSFSAENFELFDDEKVIAVRLQTEKLIILVQHEFFAFLVTNKQPSSASYRASKKIN